MTTKKKSANKQRGHTQQTEQARLAAQAPGNQDVPIPVSPSRFDEIEARERAVVPLIEEKLNVDKAWVQAGVVELRKSVQTREQTLPFEVAHEEVQIERVTVNRALAEGEGAGPRQEGDLLIIPIIEEELVVTKRKVVREEVRIRKTQVTTQQQVSDTLKSEQLEITNTDGLRAVED